jgi:hypothetical protein
MAGKTEKVTSGEAYAGQPCILCKKEIAAEDEVVVCPRCRSVQHADCWKSKGGCGRAGCPQIAQAVIGEKPKGDGPPPPVSKKAILGGVLAAATLILYLIFKPAPPDPAMGRTKIVFLAEADYQLDQVITELAEAWNADSEEIYIDLQLLPAGAIDAKLVVLIAAGDPPDVFAVPEDRFDFFAEQGSLLALDYDQEGQPIYGIQHPAQLTKLVIWGDTVHPEEALTVLHYFRDNIPPADLEALRERGVYTIPMLGF